MGARWGGAAALLLVLVAACTSDPAPKPQEVESTAPDLPSGTEGSSDPAAPTTRPLVLAVNARRPPIDVTEALARRVARGEVDNWRELGEPAGPLTVTDRTDTLAHLPMDTVAAVVADAVTPAVRVVDVNGVDPLKDPQHYPVQVTGPAPRVPTTLTVVGDIMLGRQVGDRASAEGDPSYPLRPMQDRLASADLTVGNFEGTLSDNGEPRQPGDDSFNADPRVRSGLREAGFDALDLANNHTGDFGDTALVETVSRLRDRGLDTFGAGRGPRQAWQPTIVERHGVRFGFLAFNAIGETPEVGPGRPGAVSISMPPRTGPLDRGELGRFLAAVRRLAALVDVVTVMPHWGTQYTERPEPIQARVARALADAGADLVIGGHPHWVQGASLVGDTLVVNSLGNFVFDMDSTETQEGLVLEAVFWGDQLMAVEFVPYRIGPDFAPRVVPYADAAGTFDLFWRFSGLGATPR
ncbi:CapA family protein [Nocardioides sp.]|uniref:CapA family protein n=1 Tax=Nocardioides sp. TaxID=35761 RepID=UPI0031FEC3F1|nr:hypothetical protein [Nocardioides sp.]